jgi:hypothetical protein
MATLASYFGLGQQKHRYELVLSKLGVRVCPLTFFLDQYY